MSQLLDELREEFRDEESRYAYVEAHLNTSVAAQIKKFRAEMSQQELADKIGTKQSGISRLENANYSAWKVETLRKLAHAFGLRLRISFEEFGTLIPEIENFKRGVLNKRRFEDDPAFKASVSERMPEDVTATWGSWGHLANAKIGDLSLGIRLPKAVQQGGGLASVLPKMTLKQMMRLEKLETRFSDTTLAVQTNISIPQAPGKVVFIDRDKKTRHKNKRTHRRGSAPVHLRRRAI